MRNNGSVKYCTLYTVIPIARRNQKGRSAVEARVPPAEWCLSCIFSKYATWQSICASPQGSVSTVRLRECVLFDCSSGKRGLSRVSTPRHPERKRRTTPKVLDHTR